MTISEKFFFKFALIKKWILIATVMILDYYWLRTALFKSILELVN